MLPKRRMSSAGASLIELLVVMAVMAITMSLILVAIQRSREVARRAMCQSNLHQISVAMRTFVELRKRIPEPPPMGEVGGWNVELLPFLEEQHLADQLLGNPLFTTQRLSPILRQRPAGYTCPSAYEGESETAGIPAAHYAMEPPARRQNLGGREYYTLGDVDVDCRLPWPAGPELQLGQLIYHYRKPGPHAGGFIWINSRTEAATFILPKP